MLDMTGRKNGLMTRIHIPGTWYVIPRLPSRTRYYYASYALHRMSSKCTRYIAGLSVNAEPLM